MQSDNKAHHRAPRKWVKRGINGSDVVAVRFDHFGASRRLPLIGSMHLRILGAVVGRGEKITVISRQPLLGLVILPHLHILRALLNQHL